MLINAGCDWLRATTEDPKVIDQWREIARVVFEDYFPRTRKGKIVQRFGYRGLAVPGMFFGTGKQGAMIDVSSDTAAMLAWSIMKCGGRASRVDFQVTDQSCEAADRILHRAYKAGCAHKYGRGKEPEVAIIDTKRGAKMMMIGSRTSVHYGRIYDKFRESKEDRYRDCVRWEVELKEEAAHAAGEAIRQSRNMSDLAQGYVVEWFEARGVPVPALIRRTDEEVLPLRRSKQIDTTRSWLATQVAPTIMRVQQEIGLSQTMLDVFGKAMDDDAIISLIEAAIRVHEHGVPLTDAMPVNGG